MPFITAIKTSIKLWFVNMLWRESSSHSFFALDVFSWFLHRAHKGRGICKHRNNSYCPRPSDTLQGESFQYWTSNFSSKWCISTFIQSLAWLEECRKRLGYKLMYYYTSLTDSCFTLHVFHKNNKVRCAGNFSHNTLQIPLAIQRYNHFTFWGGTS